MAGYAHHLQSGCRANAERLAALSDGVFAVAMTLLVLDLHAPVAEAVRSEQGLWNALQPLGPRLLMYAMSFLTLGIFWVGQQTQLNHLERSERSLSWIHLVFLFGVSLTPFSTSLLAEFPQYRDRPAGILGQYSVARRHSILQLDLRHRQPSGEGRPAGGDRTGHPQAHRDRAKPVRLRGGAVPARRLLEHRLHRVGTTLLRLGAGTAAAEAKIGVSRGRDGSPGSLTGSHLF